MKTVTSVALVALLANAVVAQPPFLAKLSGGPPSFLRDGLIKFLERVNTACEGSELKTCKCLTDQEHIGIFKTVKEVQECKPTICNCADGSRISPAVPEFLRNKSNNNLHPLAISLKEKFKERASVILRICNGDLPEKCPCDEDEQEPIIPPFVTPEAVHKCNPSKCVCDNGDEVDLPRTEIRSKLTEHIAAVKALCNGETPETCTCSNNDKIDFEDLIKSTQNLLDCLPEICTCTDGTDLSVPTIEPPPFAQKMLKRLHQKINTICPGELPAQTCQCSNDKSGIDSLDDFGKTRDILRCRPNACTCADGSSVEVEQPEAPKFMKELVEKYTGGLPGCGIGDFDLSCGNELQITLLSILKAHTSDSCVCEDGRAPLCINNNEPPKCPNGEAVQLEIGQPPAFLKKCRA
ncbi:uncharacterized protein LOC131893218 isoform X2 [Tigriopus californicus]|uniref:uncharacterized protein LOC131893218 isoform X2 n=1 Tax=Tigriopus californicus TaxID=6832 RepID=UPI0027D9D861|nr:uncharacterized protein LOC131893218 isoform X2 [Tigriopus californicus]